MTSTVKMRMGTKLVDIKHLPLLTFILCLAFVAPNTGVAQTSDLVCARKDGLSVDISFDQNTKQVYFAGTLVESSEITDSFIRGKVGVPDNTITFHISRRSGMLTVIEKENKIIGSIKCELSKKKF